MNTSILICIVVQFGAIGYDQVVGESHIYRSSRSLGILPCAKQYAFTMVESITIDRYVLHLMIAADGRVGYPIQYTETRVEALSS